MYRKTIREMTETEREELIFELERYQHSKSIIEPRSKPTIYQLFLKTFLFVCGLLLPFIGIIILSNLRVHILLTIFSIGTYLILTIFLYERLERTWRDFLFDRSMASFGRRIEMRNEKDLSDGRVVERQIQARSVVEFRSPIEECDGLVFDLGDDRVFLIHNDGNFPSESDTALWPNSDFEVVHSRSQTRILNLVLRGSLLTPIRVLSANQFDQEKFWRLNDGLIEADLQSFIDSLQL
ncbi:MAG: hypothetical protein KDA68_17925 [Planctomycetaceae bacterium]|nr:hypothetical protein [Planctomycetaceae bacterium]